MKKIVLFFADFEPIMCNEKRGFTASQEIGQTTFVLKKRQYKEIERLAAPIDNHHCQEERGGEVNDS